MATSASTDTQLDYPPEPDVYETAATISDSEATSPQANDESSSQSGEESEGAETSEDGPFGSISHRRLMPQRARSKFQAFGSNRVDSRGLDLSDRVDGRRRGLRIRSAVNGRAEDENLEAKIARLRREIEECRLEAEQEGGQKGPTNTGEEIQQLGKALAQLETSSFKAEARPQPEPKKLDSAEADQDEHTLNSVAAFDTRLTSLERALGIASLDINSDGTYTAPVLPSIDLLDQQVSALLTSASIVQLDAASSRVRKLTHDAEQLSRLRAVPVAPESGDDAETEEPTTFSPADMEKLNSLYNLLPTLQQLAPTVPALLERLRSMVALHSGAANAASELDSIEKRQADTDAELKAWTEGLKRVESAVEDASQANGRNGKMVQGWVKDLEARLAALQ